MSENREGRTSHDHVYLGERHDENARRTLWVVALSGAMMVAEIVAGLAFNSMALLADGFHMATHVGALGLSAVAYVYAKRHARSPRFSFGTGKVGDLAAFASALCLALVAIGIGVESLQRLLDPRQVAFEQAIWVAVVGLIVNVASALLLGGDHHPGHAHAVDDDGDHHDHGGHHHREGHDNNLRSAYVHVLADALTSVLAISALLGVRYLGWLWLDPLMGLVGGCVIIGWSWSLLRASAAVLLDMNNPALEDKVREQIERCDGTSIVDLHVWRLSPTAHAAIVSVSGSEDGEAIRRRLAHLHGLAHVTVETLPPRA